MTGVQHPHLRAAKSIGQPLYSCYRAS